MAALLAALALSAAASARADIVIDGVIDEDEWAGALHFTDFVSVQPLTRAPAPDDRRAEAFLKSTPAGIAVAIRAWHPPEVPQTRARMQRDGGAQIDRVNFMVDFNADGRTGYGFTVTTMGDVIDEVITNETSFDKDWDGVWESAVADFPGGYTIELLLPWTIAPMAGSAAPTRTIGVYFDRVIAATGERFAWPAASFTRARFVSDFAPIEIAQYRQPLLAVTPYASLRHDLVDARSQTRAGADLFWKPTGDHQFAATLNPDFGHVESDALVVDFSAIEVFFSDRRPFFAENQSAYRVAHPLGELFYTRRVGGPADDGSGAADIDLAIKADGSVGNFGYALFTATEDGAAGRDFSLLRARYTSATLDLGTTVTRTERPFLDRSADVAAIDATWRPSERWLVRPLLVQSAIDTPQHHRRGRGGGVVADWELPGPWRQQYFALWADRDLDINDLGYLARNDFRYFEWETGYRNDHLPAASRFASHDWEFELIRRDTLDGLRLQQSATVYRSSRLKSGGSTFGLVRWRWGEHDDLISRGHGPIRLSGGPGVYWSHTRPRAGDRRFGLAWDVDVYPNAVRGHTTAVGVRPRWQPHESFELDWRLSLRHHPDWLLWHRRDEFGSYRAQRVESSVDLNWFIDRRHELRAKVQAIAVDARALQPRRRVDDGRLVNGTHAIDDFRVRNFGLQLRYRYRLGHLSDLFVVYSRGGYAIDAMHEGGVGRALVDSLSLRDSDQFLIKLAYRFEPFR